MKIMNVYFNSLDRCAWLRMVSDAHRDYCSSESNGDVIIHFNELLRTDKINSIHIASLACLIESFATNGNVVKIDKRSMLGEYIFTSLKFRDYWAGGKNYVELKNDNIFNLWRLKDSEKEMVPIKVCEYFKRRQFKHKDLSSVQLSLDEAFYNVFDHAQANGNAFLFLKFNEEKGSLSVAVCDFGRGIPSSVKAFNPEVKSDDDALELAMQDAFTIKSQGHNRGFGLGNIRSAGVEGDSLWIVSNSASLVSYKGEVKTFHNDFYFPGTAVFYDLTLKEFEDEEIIDTFEIDF